MVRGSEGWGWDQELAAQQVELLHWIGRLHLGKRAKRVKPYKVPRPGEQKKKLKKSPAKRLADAVRTLNGR